MFHISAMFISASLPPFLNKPCTEIFRIAFGLHTVIKLGIRAQLFLTMIKFEPKKHYWFLAISAIRPVIYLPVGSGGTIFSPLKLIHYSRRAFQSNLCSAVLIESQCLFDVHTRWDKPDKTQSTYFILGRRPLSVQQNRFLSPWQR